MGWFDGSSSSYGRIVVVDLRGLLASVDGVVEEWCLGGRVWSIVVVPGEFPGPWLRVSGG